MMVSRPFTAVVALVALLAGGALLLATGCGRRDADLLPPETDEPLFVQGVQANRQQRKSEALASFLKVIEKRGERFAPESHFEAGLLYLNHTKDPVEAYHHFRKYLELQPNSRQAPFVRGMVDAAKREFYKTLAAPPQGDAPSRPSDHAVRLAMDQEVEKLRRENAELRAEVQTLRGGGANNRQARMITLPPETRPAATTPPATQRAAEAPLAPAPRVSLPDMTRTTQPSGRTAAPSTKSAAQSKSTASPAKNTARPTGRTHTVQPKQTLYAIAKQYGVKLEDLAKANGIANPASVPAGTVLRIP